MESLLTSPTPDRYAMRRHLTRKETDPVSHRYQYVLALHLSGKTVKEIEKLTSYKSPTIYKILAMPNVNYLRQQLLNHTAKEFEALFGKTVQVIRDGLKSRDMKIALDAADKWLKAHGKYQKSEGTQINITAEDIVMNILNQRTPDGQTFLQSSVPALPAG